MIRWSTALWRDDSLWIPLLVFLALRLVTGVAVAIMLHNNPTAAPEWLAWNPSGQTYAASIPDGAPLADVVRPWHVYDTLWYVRVAIQGYTAGDPSIVFPPLYPILIRTLAPLMGGNNALAALVISNSACLVVFILLFRLIRHEFKSRGLATRTLIFVAAFPTSYYLLAGYTETLYLSLVLGAFLSALHRRWLLAGTLAFFAGLTRLQGALLCIPLAWIAFVQLREYGLKAQFPKLVAVGGGILGTLSYMAYVTINQLGSFESAFNKEWQLYTQLPFQAFADFFTRLSQGRTLPYENDNFLALVLMVVLGIVVTLRMRPPYALYVWTTIGLLLLRYHEGAQFESIFRYSLMLFPCFVALAMLLPYGWQIGLYIAYGGQWMFVLLDRFIHWIWVA